MMVSREKMAPCNYTACLLCHKLVQHPLTIPVCLHSFCRKCIYEKLSDGGIKRCPLCDTNPGCISVDKLRLDQNLHDLMANIFPLKRKVETLEVSSLSKIEETSLPSLVGTPITSMQVVPNSPPATEEFSAKGEILATECHKSSVMKRRRLEEILGGPMRVMDCQPCLNLRVEGGISLLGMAHHLVHGTAPSELSEELMKTQHPDTFQWMKYLFDHFINRASTSHKYKDIELQKAIGKEDAHMDQCGEFEQKSSNLRSDHDMKMKEQADFYEAKLKEQAEHYEAKVKFLENELTEKWKELFRQNKKLEELSEVIEQKDTSIGMLFQLAEDCGTKLKETVTSLEVVKGQIIALEEQAKGIPKLQEESHRAGMEGGVKRVVRAVQAASRYVNWDQIHILEDTTDEDREALQRAFAEGIITAPSPMTQGEHQSPIIFL